MKTNAWFQTFMTLDPSDYWSKVSAPVLILNGDKDVQVSADINTKAIQDALPSDTDCDVLKLYRASIIFFKKPRQDRFLNMQSLNRRFPLQFLNVMSEWIVNQSQ